VPAESAPKGAPLVIAVEVEGGLAIPRDAFAKVVPAAAELYNAAGEVVARTEPLAVRDQAVFVPIAAAQRREVSSVRLRAASGVAWIALIHRPTEILDLAQSSKQVKLKEALSGLGGNTEDLGKLIATIERVIFDEPEAAAGDRRTRSAKAQEDPRRGRERPESLEVELDAQKKRPLRRILETGDLAYLLDALLRQLGIGLERSEASIDDKGRSEEEQVSQDDSDEPPQPRPEIDDVDVAKLCRGKVRRVVSRIGQQLARAAEAKSKSATILLQLVAVLALLRELRTIEKNPRWLKIHETLVDPDALEQLYLDVLAYLFGRKYQLYEAITTTLGDERFDELARMKGLLIWLAWECGVKLDERFSIAEAPEDVEQRVQDKAALLEFALIMQADTLARVEASESITRTATSGRAGAGAAWLAQYSRWADRIEGVVRKLESGVGVKRGSLHCGDLAVITTVVPPRPRVVAGVSSDRVTLVDFGEDSTTISYQPSRVERVAV